MIKTKQYSFILKDFYAFTDIDKDDDMYLAFCESDTRDFDELIRICMSSFTDFGHVGTVLRRCADEIDMHHANMQKKIRTRNGGGV